MTKTVVITGANRGIGLAMCQQCVARGDEVYAICRRSSKALDKLDLNVITDIDVAEKKTLLV